MSEATLTAAGDGRWVLGGILNFSSVPQIWPAVAQLVEQGGQFTLSLTDVSQANSAGLVMLVEARDLARRVNARLRLVDIPTELQDLASMSGCEELIAENRV